MDPHPGATKRPRDEQHDDHDLAQLVVSELVVVNSSTSAETTTTTIPTIITNLEDASYRQQRQEKHSANLLPKQEPNQKKSKKQPSDEFLAARALKASIAACMPAGDFNLAFTRAQAAMSTGVKLGAHIHGLLLSIATRANRVDKKVMEDALTVFDHMLKEGGAASESSFTSLIKVCASAGSPQEGVKQLERMCEAGLLPRLRTYGGLISSFADQGDLFAVKQMFRHMKGKNIDASQEEYARLLKLLRQERIESEGLALLREMVDVRECYVAQPALAKAAVEFFSAGDGNTNTNTSSTTTTSAAVAVAAVAVVEAATPTTTTSTTTTTLSWPWRSAKVLIDVRSGICPITLRKMRSLDLTREQFAAVADKCKTLTGVTEADKNVFANFSSWLTKQGQYDIIIDGANVGFHGQNFGDGGLSYTQVDVVARHFQAQGKRVLIVMSEKWLQPRYFANPEMRRPFKKRFNYYAARARGEPIDYSAGLRRFIGGNGNNNGTNNNNDNNNSSNNGPSNSSSSSTTTTNNSGSTGGGASGNNSGASANRTQVRHLSTSTKSSAVSTSAIVDTTIAPTSQLQSEDSSIVEKNISAKQTNVGTASTTTIWTPGGGVKAGGNNSNHIYVDNDENEEEEDGQDYAGEQEEEELGAAGEYSDFVQHQRQLANQQVKKNSNSGGGGGGSSNGGTALHTTTKPKAGVSRGGLKSSNNNNNNNNNNNDDDEFTSSDDQRARVSFGNSNSNSNKNNIKQGATKPVSSTGKGIVGAGGGGGDGDTDDTSNGEEDEDESNIVRMGPGVTSKECLLAEGPEEDSAQAASIIERWKAEKMVYSVVRGHNDDWFWMYAAVTQPDPYKVRVVSNDLMRDHHFQMLATDMFQTWRERHQVRYAVQRTGIRAGAGGKCIRASFLLRAPLPFSHRMQESDDGLTWHIPVEGKALIVPVSATIIAKDVSEEEQKSHSTTTLSQGENVSGSTASSSSSSSTTSTTTTTSAAIASPPVMTTADVWITAWRSDKVQVDLSKQFQAPHDQQM